MRRLGLVLLIAAALPASAAAAGDEWARATIAPSRPAAQTVLTLQLHYEMTCGQPAGAITVRFPARMQLLKSFSVHLGAKTLPAVVTKSTVVFQIPRPGVTCMSIAPATATFTFSGLRNPASAGAYVIRAQAQNRGFATRVLVRA
jgi:hypothetical protein